MLNERLPRTRIGKRIAAGVAAISLPLGLGACADTQANPKIEQYGAHTVIVSPFGENLGAISKGLSQLGEACAITDIANVPNQNDAVMATTRERDCAGKSRIYTIEPQIINEGDIHRTEKATTLGDGGEIIVVLAKGFASDEDKGIEAGRRTLVSKGIRKEVFVKNAIDKGVVFIVSPKISSQN